MAAPIDLNVAASPNGGPVGGDLRLTLGCPRCGAQGWVLWERLRRGLRCPRCQCHFLMGHNGRLQSAAELPHLRFDCPRCKQSGEIPAFYALKKVECGSCRLPLELGPDHRLHGEKEALRLRRNATAGGRVAQKFSFREKVGKLFRTESGHLSKSSIAVSILIMLCVAAVVVASLRYFLADSAERQVRRFTYASLAGDWRDAEGFLEDSDVARVEFRRWRSYHFTSILDAYRPSGDRVSIEIESLTHDENSRIMRVMIKSTFIGTREHRQHWRRHDGDWQFDVLQTLRDIDGDER